MSSATDAALLINTSYIKGSHDKTELYLNDTKPFHTFERPIYYISLSLIGTSFLTGWRNQSPNNLRRAAYGVGTFLLGIAGLVEAVARSVFAVFVLPFSRNHASGLAVGAALGGLVAIFSISILPMENCSEKEMPFFRG